MKIARTLVIAALAVCVAGNAFAFGTSKFEQEVATETAAVKLVKEVIQGGYGIINAAELKAMMDKGDEMLIVDTMPYEDSYKKNHIPGAKQFLFPIPDMPVWKAEETGGKTEADFKALLGADLNKKIVFYCGFVKCTRSHNAAVWAKKLGYTNVYRQPGGIFAWKGADYEVAAEK
jgi:thiosulfate/3-mercaptopyruvate sulfurtransferase